MQLFAFQYGYDTFMLKRYEFLRELVAQGFYIEARLECTVR